MPEPVEAEVTYADPVDPEVLGEALNASYPDGFSGWVTLDGDPEPSRPLSQGPAGDEPAAILTWFRAKMADSYPRDHEAVELVALEFRRSAGGRGWHARFKVSVDGSQPSIRNVMSLRKRLGDDEHRLEYDSRRMASDPASIGGWLQDRKRVTITGKGGIGAEHVWKTAGPWIAAYPAP